MPILTNVMYDLLAAIFLKLIIVHCSCIFWAYVFMLLCLKFKYVNFYALCQRIEIKRIYIYVSVDNVCHIIYCITCAVDVCCSTTRSDSDVSRGIACQSQSKCHHWN